MGDEPELPEYRIRTAAFGRIMREAHDGQTYARTEAPRVETLARVRDDELVLLSQAGGFAKLSVWQEAVAAEVARRTVAALKENREAVNRSSAALVEFKDASVKSSRRLETLRRWLIALTITLVVLSLALVVHDLTR
jgi:hypothetical protein